MKKGAMFGLDCRTLRKQFWELFLVSRQSEDSKGSSGSCVYTKRGAMFGLDARIALAIFGALSVISGAALYSVIQDAKAVALMSEMQEVGKAWEQYYLDTGQNLPRESSSTTLASYYQLKVKRLLVRVDESNWKGPYLPYIDSGHDRYITSPNSANIFLLTLNNENIWGEITPWNDGGSDGGRCLSGYECSLWVEYCGIVSESVIKVLDDKYDNSTGSTEGNFKWVTGGCVYFKYAPVANPHD